MKIALAQINPTVGDLEGNVDLCRNAIMAAGELGAELVILPEMCVPGYPPRDILLDDSFSSAVLEATQDLAWQVRDHPPAIVGSLALSQEKIPGHPGLYNAAYLLSKGFSEVVAEKRLLPVYDVFYEPRWFMPGRFHPPVQVGGIKLGVIICEDMWDEGYPVHPGVELVDHGADLLVCISAAPYRKNRQQNRYYHARRQGLGLIYVNQWGANDELIFDGRSFAVNSTGAVVKQLPGFQESIELVETEHMHPQAETTGVWEQEIFEALKLGISDFVRKNHLERVFVGASGGIDSSVVLVLAAKALGPERVTAVAIPSRFTDPRSTECARELAHRLGTGFEVVPLEDLHCAAERTQPALLVSGNAAENVQARLRMIILMNYVNFYGGMLLNTSNKTELTTGYTTLYGDMSGTLCPIADLTKPEIYALARWLNLSFDDLIPSFALDRPPSAELKAGQIDPFDYDELSPRLEQLVQGDRSNHLMRITEHKRWQMGIILKVSERAFGRGRMMPVTRG